MDHGALDGDRDGWFVQGVDYWRHNPLFLERELAEVVFACVSSGFSVEKVDFHVFSVACYS